MKSNVGLCSLLTASFRSFSFICITFLYFLANKQTNKRNEEEKWVNVIISWSDSTWAFLSFLSFLLVLGKLADTRTDGRTDTVLMTLHLLNTHDKARREKARFASPNAVRGRERAWKLSRERDNKKKKRRINGTREIREELQVWSGGPPSGLDQIRSWPFAACLTDWLPHLLLAAHLVSSRHKQTQE